VCTPGGLRSGPRSTEAARQREGPVESHAWAEVHVPGTGWVEVDPTHLGAVDDPYVRLAVGRDCGDAVPLEGTYVGGRDGGDGVEVALDELPA
jgi:transglutaminase-like putative cysteine protease